MAIVDRELTELVDQIKRSPLKVRVHTVPPGDEETPDVTTGIPTAGGNNYTDGVTVAASGWNGGDRANGFVVDNKAAIDFGAANADVGTLNNWSVARGTNVVAIGDLPATIVNNGDTFQINANTLKFDANSTPAAT